MLRAVKLIQMTKQRLGRRGSSLLFFSFLDFVFCWFLVTAPSQLTQSPSYQFITSTIPLWGWATAWGTAGLACLIFAFRKKDAIGFVAEMAVMVSWSAMYFSGEVLGRIPFGYVSAAVYFALAVQVRIISGWPEEEVVNGQ